MSEPYWQCKQPLRIPGGWTIDHNKLEDLEPADVPKQDEPCLSFTEDILSMHTTISRKRNKKTEQQKLIIDLGWYPDGDLLNGNFRLQAVLNDDWMQPLLTFSTRSKDEAVKMLEQWLFREFGDHAWIDEQNFRKDHPVSKDQDLQCKYKGGFYEHT